MMSSLADFRTVSSEKMARLSAWNYRKPVVAIMGEFSAGKSTLLNMLIGESVLPTQVTATKLPPVWLRYGTEEPYRVDKNNVRHSVDVENLTSVPIRETRYIRIYMTSEVLESCDLLDTPGISDPNMPMTNWIRTIGYANAVLWCTHAGQAWRESERSAWESLPPRLRLRSLLLVTRADKIVSDIDRMKIDTRLRRETESLFGDRVFISLTNALRALEGEGDPDLWSASGAETFVELLANSIAAVNDDRNALLRRYKLDPSAAPRILPRRVRGALSDAPSERPVAEDSQPEYEDIQSADIVQLRNIRGLETSELREQQAEVNDVSLEAESVSPYDDSFLGHATEASHDAPDDDLTAAFAAATDQEDEKKPAPFGNGSTVDDLVYEPLEFHELPDVPALGSGKQQQELDTTRPLEAPVEERLVETQPSIAAPEPHEGASQQSVAFSADDGIAKSDDLPADLSASALWRQVLSEYPITSVQDLVDAMTDFVGRIDSSGLRMGNVMPKDQTQSGTPKGAVEAMSGGRRRKFRD